MVHKKLAEIFASEKRRAFDRFCNFKQNIRPKTVWTVCIGVVLMIFTFRPFLDTVDYLRNDDTKMINQEIANITSVVLEIDVRHVVETFLWSGIYLLEAEFVFTYYTIYLNVVHKIFPDKAGPRYFYRIHELTGHFIQLLIWIWVVLEYGLLFTLWQFKSDNVAKHNFCLNVVICVIIMQLFYGVFAQYGMRRLKNLVEEEIDDEEYGFEEEFDDVQYSKPEPNAVNAEFICHI